MKKHYLNALFLLIFSCNSKIVNNTEPVTGMSISMDTVVIDSKGEILYLNNNIGLSDFSSDMRYIYNFNNNNYSLEKIDLDNLEFEKRITFEKNGPDRLGDYINTVQNLDDNSFYFSAINEKGVFDLNGKKKYDLNMKEDELSPKLPDGYFFGSFTLLVPGSHFSIVGNLDNWDSGGFKVATVNPVEKTWEEVQIPEFDFLKEFRTIWMGENGPMGITGRWISTRLVDGKIIISNNVSADFYSFELETKELRFIRFEHELIENRKQGTYPREVQSKEEFEKVNREFGKEINFLPPVYDEKNNRFFRFSYKNKWVEYSSNWKNDGAEVFLTVLDADFRIVNELQLPQFKNAPNFHFVKDGKIWVFNNMNDEMGFIRLSLQNN